MAFDCNNCLANCKADCCHQPVPMENTFIATHIPIRPIIRRQALGDNMSVVTANDERLGDMSDGKIHGVCPFLGMDDKCSVYADRPTVCKMFGNEMNVFMTCSFQAADGRVRSRQERRQIERKLFPAQIAAIKRLKEGTATAEDKAQAIKTAADWPADDPQKKRLLNGESGY